MILVGDTTSHGGRVLEGTDAATVNGRAIAGVGHMVACPQCKGTFPILPDTLGRLHPHRLHGRDTAVEGMRTACGAVLVASQSTATIEDVGEGEGSHAAAAGMATTALAPSQTLCLECLKTAAESAATTVMRG